MRVALTLLVRDEVDLVAANVRYHLALGVDHVVVTDHRSTDGTTDVLRQLEGEGRVHAPPGGVRGAPAVELGDQHGAPRRDRARGRLGDQQRRRRVLVAARRHAPRRTRSGTVAFRRSEGPLAELRPAPGRGSPLRGTHDRATAACDRPDRPVPRAGEGRPPRPGGRRRHAGEPRRPRPVADAGPRMASVRDPALPIRSLDQARRKFRVARTAGLASPGTSIPQHTEAAVHSMDTYGEASFYRRLVVDEAARARPRAVSSTSTPASVTPCGQLGPVPPFRRPNRPHLPTTWASRWRLKRCSSTTAG